MFGIGFSELVLIGLLLIIFIKPEDLPKFFRSVGKFYGQMKKAYTDVVSVKDKLLKEIDDAATLEEKAAEAQAVRPDAAPPRQLEQAKVPEGGKNDDVPAGESEERVKPTS